MDCVQTEGISLIWIMFDMDIVRWSALKVEYVTCLETWNMSHHGRRER